MKKNNSLIDINFNKLSPHWLLITKIAIVIFLLSTFIVAFYFFQPDFIKAPTPNKATVLPVVNISESQKCLDCKARLFDGVIVAPQLEKSRPFAVMIDNHPAARPAFGLSAASLVYEAPVEGGITRYLAFFLPELTPAKIGPVRSARDYYVELAQAMSATYVHCGGSPEALIKAKSLGNNDLNEFYKGSYFWRENNRPAPHNILTSGINLNKYRLDYSEKNTDFGAWSFKQGGEPKEILVPRIDIKYPDVYAVYWQYDKTTNKYLRYLNGKIHTDDSGTEIKTDNLIIHLSSFVVSDEKLRLKMSDSSSGQALLCQDGNCQLGQFKKSDSTSRTKYYLKNGTEFVFNAGITWVEIIGDWRDLQY